MNMSLEYLEMQVESASHGQRLIMLHDGLMKFARVAIRAIDEGNYAMASQNLVYAENIALHLRSSLVHDQAPDLVQNLEHLYSYWYLKLLEANQQKSTEIIRELLPLVQQMRDAWSSVEEQLNREGNE